MAVELQVNYVFFKTSVYFPTPKNENLDEIQQLNKISEKIQTLKDQVNQINNELSRLKGRADEIAGKLIVSNLSPESSYCLWADIENVKVNNEILQKDTKYLLWYMDHREGMGREILIEGKGPIKINSSWHIECTESYDNNLSIQLELNEVKLTDIQFKNASYYYKDERMHEIYQDKKKTSYEVVFGEKYSDISTKDCKEWVYQKIDQSNND